jgi:hypothetical protein
VILKILFLTFGDWKPPAKKLLFHFPVLSIFLAKRQTPVVGLLLVVARLSPFLRLPSSVFLAAAVAAAAVVALLLLLLLLLLLSFPSLGFSRLRVSPILITHDSAPPQNPSPPPPLH